MTTKRDIKSSDWKVIDDFHETLLTAFQNDEMTRQQYLKWITHFVGLTANAGIDETLKGMNQALNNRELSGWTWLHENPSRKGELNE